QPRTAAQGRPAAQERAWIEARAGARVDDGEGAAVARMKRKRNPGQLYCVRGASIMLPRVVHAQRPAMPVIRYLNASGQDSFYSDQLRALRDGLKETGYVEGENVTIEYRRAESEPARLPVRCRSVPRPRGSRSERCADVRGGRA